MDKNTERLKQSIDQLNAGGWQPIETAPVGEWILVARQGKPNSVLGAMQISDGAFSIGFDFYRNPTHWMPLPPSPEAD